MTIYITSVRIAAEHLATAKDRAYNLVNGTKDAFGKAATYSDPMLSTDGVAAKRADLKATFRTAAGNDLEKLTKETAHARKSLAEYAAENTRLPQDTATLMQAQMRWDQVRMQLDAGRDLHQVLGTADEATALAIAEYAPAWVRAHATVPESLGEIFIRESTGTEPTPDQAVTAVQQAVYRRLADVATDPALRELLTAEVNADAHMAVATPWVNAARNLIDGDHVDMLGAAVASRLAQPAQTAPDTEAA